MIYGSARAFLAGLWLGPLLVFLHAALRLAGGGDSGAALIGTVAMALGLAAAARVRPLRRTQARLAAPLVVLATYLLPRFEGLVGRLGALVDSSWMAAGLLLVPLGAGAVASLAAARPSWRDRHLSLFGGAAVGMAGAAWTAEWTAVTGLNPVAPLLALSLLWAAPEPPAEAETDEDHDQAGAADTAQDRTRTPGLAETATAAALGLLAAMALPSLWHIAAPYASGGERDRLLGLATLLALAWAGAALLPSLLGRWPLRHAFWSAAAAAGCLWALHAVNARSDPDVWQRTVDVYDLAGGNFRSAREAVLYVPLFWSIFFILPALGLGAAFGAGLEAGAGAALLGAWGLGAAVGSVGRFLILVGGGSDFTGVCTAASIAAAVALARCLWTSFRGPRRAAAAVGGAAAYLLLALSWQQPAVDGSSWPPVKWSRRVPSPPRVVHPFDFARPKVVLWKDTPSGPAVLLREPDGTLVYRLGADPVYRADPQTATLHRAAADLSARLAQGPARTLLLGLPLDEWRLGLAHGGGASVLAVPDEPLTAGLIRAGRASRIGDAHAQAPFQLIVSAPQPGWRRSDAERLSSDRLGMLEGLLGPRGTLIVWLDPALMPPRAVSQSMATFAESFADTQVHALSHGYEGPWLALVHRADGSPTDDPTRLVGAGELIGRGRTEPATLRGPWAAAMRSAARPAASEHLTDTLARVASWAASDSALAMLLEGLALHAAAQPINWSIWDQDAARRERLASPMFEIDQNGNVVLGPGGQPIPASAAEWDLYAQALARDPGFGPARSALGAAARLMLRDGHLNHLVDLAQRWQALDSGNPEPWRLTGHALQRLLDPQGAVEAFERALSLAGPAAEPATRRGLGLAMVAAGRTVDGRRLLREWRGTVPDGISRMDEEVREALGEPVPDGE